MSITWQVWIGEMGKRFAIIGAGLWFCVFSIPAAAGSPELHVVQPSGVQRGTTAKLSFRGVRLAGAQEILFFESGIAATSVTTVDDATITADCVVSGDCALGEHHLRVRTTSGVTDLRTIWVGALPVVNEIEPNSDFAAPQRVSMNTTISGIVTSEDIDYYAVDAKKGQRISAEIEAMRLGRTMFDPAIAILNVERFELAVSDDSSLLLQDSTASIVAPVDGVYVLSVREASFGGNDQSSYLLHVGTFPRPTVVFPPGGTSGQSGAVALLGDPAGPIALKDFSFGAAVGELNPIFAKDADGMAPSPVFVRAGAMPCMEERLSDAASAGNDPVSSAPTPTTAPVAPQVTTAPVAPPAIPVAFHGVISKTGEIDHHRFAGKQGVGVVIAAFARRVRSPLDAVVEVFDTTGKWLAGNDDAAGSDSAIQFTPPADGEYEVRMRDHLGRGGETFVYRIEIDQARPSLGLVLERLDSKRPQHLQAVVVPRGNRFAGLIRADRQGATGAVAVEIANLPVGVSAVTEPMGADVELTPILFEATADAVLSGTLASVNGRVAGANGAPDVVGAFRQIMPLVIAPPNETVYYQTSVDRLAVAVVEAAPFKIELVQPAAALVQNGSKSLKVTIERATGFAGEIVLQMLWNPPGVSSAVTIGVAGDKNETVYPVNAAGDAPVRHSKSAVLGRANVNGGDVWVASRLIDLAVDAPFINGSLQMAATEQGKGVGILCKLEPRRAFEGKARISLVGLPPNATCEPKEVSATDTEVVFDVVTKTDAPVGQHANLFCELIVQQNGEEVNHRLAHGGVIRIDAPTVVAAAPIAAPPPPPTPAPASAPPRPLSRLEQLRKAAAEKAAGKEASQ